MQKDFHYYATYCAAVIAGYTHEESMDICYSAQFVDLCTKTFLIGIKAPLQAATTQLQIELADARTDQIGLQDMNRIWVSFHFLPKDLHAQHPKKVSKKYLRRYRLICGPNGELLKDTVELAKGSSLQAAGIAMHVLADTWAHQHFVGTPCLAINNTNDHFFEIVYKDGRPHDVPVRFKHNPGAEDDIENHVYINSIYQSSDKSIMNLGHGRAGHLPDYSFIRYRYMPAWGDYKEIVKDNPLDYAKAFTQMIYALKYLRGDIPSFDVGQYDVDAMMPWKDEILHIITKRQLDSCADWKALGEKLSGHTIDDFNIDKYRAEYTGASEAERDSSFLGKFFIAALAQKSMVTNRVYNTGNRLLGNSVDYEEKGFRGNKDYIGLIRWMKGTDI